MNGAIIRPIEKKDNPEVAKFIRSVLVDFGVPKVGTAYEDVSLDMMYETYSENSAAYFVVEEHGKLIGGAGVAQLDNYADKVCELQKMYYLVEARGRGIGSEMLEICLQKAKELGYKKCYLETMPQMEKAQQLYKRFGFIYLDGPLGDTGHFSCQVYMLRDL